MGAPEWIARFQTAVAAAMQLQTTVLHAAERLPGFQFDETMSGQVTFTAPDFPSTPQRFVVKLHAAASRLGDYLRDGRTELSGTAQLGSLVDGAPLHGSLFIWPLRQVIRYEFSFPVGDKTLHFAGQKDVRVLDFRHTMTTLPGRIVDDQGTTLGTATVVFDWADLPSFLKSFRKADDPSDYASAMNS